VGPDELEFDDLAPAADDDEEEDDAPLVGWLPRTVESEA
jgi:hypothetical protein